MREITFGHAVITWNFFLIFYCCKIASFGLLKVRFEGKKQKDMADDSITFSQFSKSHYWTSFISSEISVLTQSLVTHKKCNRIGLAVRGAPLQLCGVHVTFDSFQSTRVESTYLLEVSGVKVVHDVPVEVTIQWNCFCISFINEAESQLAF